MAGPCAQLAQAIRSDIHVDHAPAVDKLDNRAPQLCGIAPDEHTTGAADGIVMVGR